MYLIFDKNTCNSNGSLKSSTAVSVEKLSDNTKAGLSSVKPSSAGGRQYLLRKPQALAL